MINLEEEEDLIQVDSDDEGTLEVLSQWLIDKADILPSLTRFLFMYGYL
jgi:hypothetical protein